LHTSEKEPQQKDIAKMQHTYELEVCGVISYVSNKKLYVWHGHMT